MSLKALLAFVAAMTLLGLCGEARADPLPVSSPRAEVAKEEGPAPCEDMLAGHEADLQRCEAREASCQRTLAAAQADRAARHASEEELARRIAETGAELERAGEAARTRARWAWGLGTGGAIVSAVGVLLLAEGNGSLGLGLAAGGLAAASVGYLFVTW